MKCNLQTGTVFGFPEQYVHFITPQLIGCMDGKLIGTHYLCWGEGCLTMWSFLIGVLYFRQINQSQCLN